MTEHTFVTGILNAARLILLIIYALLLTIIIGCIQQHSRFLYRTLQTSTSNEQKSARGRWSACMAGICNDVRKSWHSEAPENGSGEVLPALSLRSAELGKHKAFLANRSGARPEGLWNA